MVRTNPRAAAVDMMGLTTRTHGATAAASSSWAKLVHVVDLGAAESLGSVRARTWLRATKAMILNMA